MVILCSICSDLTFEALWNQDFVFHESLKALVQSAEHRNCAFCSLLWAQIRRECTTDTINLCLAAVLPPPLSKQIEQGDADEESSGQRVIDFKVYLTGFWNPPDLAPYGDMATSLWMNCGKTLKSGSKMSTKLHVFADPGTPAASLVAGRYIAANRNHGLPLAIELTRKWLQYCRKNHKACNNTTDCSERKDGAVMPTRLIDVGSKTQTPRLIITRELPNPRQPYLALSYCWGEGVRHKIELKDDNITELCSSLPENRLTKTHQETIQFARDFGMQYIWIDSLCIIQGNKTDWEYESKRMGTVFGNAELTIIAGRAADSRNGFVTNNVHLRKDFSEPVPLKFGADLLKKDGVDLGKIYVTMPRSSMQGPVDDRGWCYQEYMLSNRSICFGTEQLTYRCRVGARQEDGDGSISEASPGRMIGATTKSEVFRRWYMMLYTFTPRQLTEPLDVFASVTSIAQIAYRVVQCRYLAGLWEGDMPRGLLWKARHQQHLPLKAPLTRPKTSGREKGEVKGLPIIRAPSWSWARVQGPVMFDTIARREPRYHGPENVFIRPRNKDNRWTIHQNCGEADRLFMPAIELQLKGRLLEVQCTANRESEAAKAEMEQYLNALPRNLNISWTPKHRKYGWLMKVFRGNNHARSENKKDGQTGTNTGDIVGGGFFDFPDEERPRNVWCLRVIIDEGLLLTRDESGKFHRIGWIFLCDAGKKLFEGADEKDVDLV